MRPTIFKEANANMQPPEGMEPDECMTLPVYKSEGVHISRWMPNREDIEAINRGEPVWLWCFGVQPPVIVDTEYPFIESEEKR